MMPNRAMAAHEQAGRDRPTDGILGYLNTEPSSPGWSLGPASAAPYGSHVPRGIEAAATPLCHKPARTVRRPQACYGPMKRKHTFTSSDYFIRFQGNAFRSRPQRVPNSCTATQGSNRMEFMLEWPEGSACDPCVVNRSTSGKYEQLFPCEEMGTENRVSAAKKILAPEAPASSPAYKPTCSTCWTGWLCRCPRPARRSRPGPGPSSGRHHEAVAVLCGQRGERLLQYAADQGYLVSVVRHGHRAFYGRLRRSRHGRGVERLADDRVLRIRGSPGDGSYAA
jgi:hypothetical protein